MIATPSPFLLFTKRGEGGRSSAVLSTTCDYKEDKTRQEKEIEEDAYQWCGELC